MRKEMWSQNNDMWYSKREDGSDEDACEHEFHKS